MRNLRARLLDFRGSHQTRQHGLLHYMQAELAEVLTGAKPGRSDKDAITLFKSVGASLEDLAAAIELWESLPKHPS